MNSSEAAIETFARSEIQPGHINPCRQEILMTDAAFSAQTMSTDDQLREALDAGDDFNRILALARQAGMLITLDGQIGRAKYQSIAGSVNAFRRFAQALCNASLQAPVR
jgi:hypothetical protein